MGQSYEIICIADIVPAVRNLRTEKGYRLNMKKNKRALTSLLACYSGSQHDGAGVGYCRSGRNGNSICQCCQPFNNDDTDAEDNDFREEDKEIPEEDPAAEGKRRRNILERS